MRSVAYLNVYRFFAPENLSMVTRSLGIFKLLSLSGSWYAMSGLAPPVSIFRADIFILRTFSSYHLKSVPYFKCYGLPTNLACRPCVEHAMVCCNFGCATQND